MMGYVVDDVSKMRVGTEERIKYIGRAPRSQGHTQTVAVIQCQQCRAQCLGWNASQWIVKHFPKCQGGNQRPCKYVLI